MAALAGEERLLIVFADVHYFFTKPGPKCLAHRFEKGSYLYLYGDTTGSGARIEVANNAGMPEQDAFTGSLDSCTIRQSYKHQNLVTISVNEYHPISGSTHSSFRHPEQHWKLPFPEPSNPRGHLQPLYAIDIYFWTSSDAEKFVSNVRRLTQYDQMQLLDFPAQPNPHEVSPLVQNLENIAVRDSPQPSELEAAHSGPQATVGKIQATPPVSPPSYQPLAYNPAAPAAPEPIKPREKTPPPVDAEAGTGLGSAAYNDQQHDPSQSGLSNPPYRVGALGPGYVPQSGTSVPSAIGSSTARIPSAVGGASVGSVPPPPVSPLSQASTPSQALVPSTTAPTEQPIQKVDSKTQPMASPASQILGSSYVTAHHQPLQHVQPQYSDYLGSTGHSTPGPIGGYSNHEYVPDEHRVQTGDDYSIHSQLYRPTEEEAKRDKRYQSIAAASTPAQEPANKLDQQSAKVDKGVNRFLKRLEKKIG